MYNETNLPFTYKGTAQQGWQCPKCGCIYAPYVYGCAKCNGKQSYVKGASLETVAEAMHWYNDTGCGWSERAASVDGKKIQDTYRNRAKAILSRVGIPYAE